MSTASDVLDSFDTETDFNEKFKKVVRDGKVVKKLVCKPGYKAQGSKCVKMSSAEKRSRSKAAIKAARTSKGSRAAAAKKRARSMKKAKNL